MKREKKNAELRKIRKIDTSLIVQTKKDCQGTIVERTGKEKLLKFIMEWDQLVEGRDGGRIKNGE